MAFLIFLFGLFVGSFLNVCIWRLPEQEQIVRGRSKCRNCGHMIPWTDNVPLLSFCLLKGVCRFCKAKISWQYPVVELATGVLFLALWRQFGPTEMTLIYAVLGAALIVVSVIDARTMEIYNQITWPGLGLGLVFSFLFPVLHKTQSHWMGLWSGIVGALVGAGIIFVMGTVGKKLFQRKLKAIGEEEAMGGGDFWLMAMVGSLIGWPKVLLVNLFFAPLVGSVAGLIARIKYKQDLIPYGPFLALGTLIALFWGEWIIRWYSSPFIGL